jgi:ribonuclease J
LANLRIIPLGGVGEIGKNLTVIEYGNDIVVIDCGLSFPDEDMLGIDLVIPDMTYLENNKDKIRGFLITHGHEDHIGALPYALKKLNAPVFGTDLTIALIKNKLEEHNVNHAKLVNIQPGDIIELGCMSIEFIKTSHSIPGSVALAITTPAGVIIHTGDFKMDFTPMDGEPVDIARFADYGSCGVLALLSDSTNAESHGYTQSEMEIGKNIEECFARAHGRVIVASFASNIYRIQQVVDVAVAQGRIVCFQGRSMLSICAIARSLGYLNIPDEYIVDVESLKDYPDERVCVITTGSQGEPMSGLFRMANSTHKLNIGYGDTIIISASAIPGNEVGMAKIINQLYQKGAEVIYDKTADVHVSGHAHRGELGILLAVTRPEYFVPIHGQYKHLYHHASLARNMGIDPEKIFLLNLGDVLEFSDKGADITETVPSGSILVDGLGIGDIGNTVLKDRRILSQEGVVVAVITISKATGALLAEPELITRGFVYVKESEQLIANAKEELKKVAQKFAETPKTDWANTKANIRSTLKNYLHEQTKRTPLIIPVVMEV